MGNIVSGQKKRKKETRKKGGRRGRQGTEEDGTIKEALCPQGTWQKVGDEAIKERSHHDLLTHHSLVPDRIFFLLDSQLPRITPNLLNIVLISMAWLFNNL